ncbi:MAG: glycosyltransferase family 2 protein [Deltaproteobacteria bacterium]|nr:glycosyltransferase family 2 protein [Deltaproteobacteria bacterium]
MKKTKSKQRISVVIPLYNEEDNVNPLYRQVTESLDGGFSEYEIIFVDDGSTDKTFGLLKEVGSQDSRVKVISFRRNFGQTAAMAAGFDYAKGDVIVPMDGDLQNDPGDIPTLVAKIEEGYDVVSGWRKSRKDPFISRKLPSMIANRLISKITGVALHDYGCSLKAYRHEVIENLRLYGEMHRFIPALASWAGAKVTEVPVNHLPRRFGKSKYGISRTFKVILDLIAVKFLLSYSTMPTRLFGKLGFSAFAFSFFSFGLTLYMKFFDGLSMNRNPLFLLSVLIFFMGVQFISIGLIAEINVRTYHESQGKPIYVIKETMGVTSGADS